MELFRASAVTVSTTRLWLFSAGRLYVSAVLLFSLLLLCSVGTALGAHGSSLGGGAEVKKDKGEERKVPLVITSQSLEANDKKGIVIFKGNVIAEQEYLLCSDSLYIGYGSGTKVDTVVAIGNVKIIYGNKIAGADRAEYKRADSKLLLTGSAVLEECGDTVRGERIELFLDEDRAVVDGGKGSKAGRVKAFIQPEKSCPDETSVLNTEGGIKIEGAKVLDAESRCRWAGQVLR